MNLWFSQNKGQWTIGRKVVMTKPMDDYEIKAGVALALFSQESSLPDKPLLGLNHRNCKSHINGITTETIRWISISLAEDILGVFQREKTKYPINYHYLHPIPSYEE